MTSEPDGPAFEIQSVTLDARHPPADSVLERLAALGTTHLTLITFAFQSAIDAPELRMHTDGGWYSESDAGIRTLARKARTLGMGLIIKPHIWVGRYSVDGQTRDQIGFETEAEWRRWEAQYQEFIMHYAHLADEVGADILVLGTELRRPARERPGFWRALAEEARTAYEGKLTYAANWYDEYAAIDFWPVLDYVGVQGYFPLTEADDPDMAALAEGWQPHMEALEQVATRAERPLLFTEVGYRSVSYAAAEPWRWPSRDETVPPDYDLQARLYRVFFACTADQPWIAGAVLWKWQAGREDARMLGFTPQNKPAEQVIRRWFTGGADPDENTDA